VTKITGSEVQINLTIMKTRHMSLAAAERNSSVKRKASIKPGDQLQHGPPPAFSIIPSAWDNE
jgi:hypothetical protein